MNEALYNASDVLHAHINSLEVVLVANVMAPRGYDNPIQKNCSETEHFTVQEFNEIYQGIVEAGFFIKRTFFAEVDFIEDIIATPKEYSTTVIFNLCRNGVGTNKKTVVPAVCDLLDVMYTSSGAGQCAVARNKSLFTSILNANNIRCPFSDLSADELAIHLSDTALVICKPNNESASQGIDQKSIVKLCEASSRCDGNILVQEYIDGYECEVPIFVIKDQCFALPPVGIDFGKNELTGILSYDNSMSNAYKFYNLSDVLPKTICETIICDAKIAFDLLNLQGYGRIDFRIDKNTHQHYVIDVSTTPYITKHSSFAFAIDQCGGEYSDIYRLILSAALYNKH